MSSNTKIPMRPSSCPRFPPDSITCRIMGATSICATAPPTVSTASVRQVGTARLLLCQALFTIKATLVNTLYFFFFIGSSPRCLSYHKKRRVVHFGDELSFPGDELHLTLRPVAFQSGICYDFGAPLSAPERGAAAAAAEGFAVCSCGFMKPWANTQRLLGSPMGELAAHKG